MPSYDAAHYTYGETMTTNFPEIAAKRYSVYAVSSFQGDDFLSDEGVMGRFDRRMRSLLQRMSVETPDPERASPQ